MSAFDELKARLAGRRVVASISGGKDSAAMSLYLTELGIEHDRVFCDTGWEHDLTYEYLHGPLVEKLGPIHWLEPKRKMEELVVHKGIFPQRTRRFCTEELKVLPLAKYLNDRSDAGEELVNAVGIRAAESEARSKMVEWDWQPSFDCEVWRPLLRWTEQDVIDVHTRHGLRPNPLYLQGAERVGCWPCIYARKSELRFLADTDPARVARLRVLEARVNEAATRKAEAKGETLTSRRAFFAAKTGSGSEMWPIDRVVEWSRTSRGGVQTELFAASGRDEGCMRWGLCETSSAKKVDLPEPRE